MSREHLLSRWFPLPIQSFFTHNITISYSLSLPLALLSLQQQCLLPWTQCPCNHNLLNLQIIIYPKTSLSLHCQLSMDCHPALFPGMDLTMTPPRTNVRIPSCCYVLSHMLDFVMFIAFLFMNIICMCIHEHLLYMHEHYLMYMHEHVLCTTTRKRGKS